VPALACHNSIDLGDDIAITKIKVRLIEIPLGLHQLCFRLFDSRRVLLSYV